MPPTRETVQLRIEQEETESGAGESNEEPEDTTDVEETISLVYDDEGNALDQAEEQERVMRKERRKNGAQKNKPDPQRIQELRAKLASRIQELREKRKAPGTSVRGAPLNREAILAARRERDKIKHEKVILKRKRDEEQEELQEDAEDGDTTLVNGAENEKAAMELNNGVEIAESGDQQQKKSLKKQKKMKKRAENERHEDSFKGHGRQLKKDGSLALKKNKNAKAKKIKKRAGFEGRRPVSKKAKKSQ